MVSEIITAKLKPVVLASYSKKEAGHNFCDIILPYHNYYRIKIVARYHKTMTAPPTP